MKLFPVILSGGAGSRLWPVSRELHPKPFMTLADGESLLQKTFLRAAALPDVEQILTVTNSDLFYKTEEQYSKLHSSLHTSFLLEPVGRNTAPAIAAAATYLAQTAGPDSLMLVLSADHLISDPVAFGVAVEAAVHLAQDGQLVTFGITPNHPDTAYGYIEADGHKVSRFVEKPTLEKARQYLASGNYLWNAGIFCFKVSAVLAELEACAPEVMRAIDPCMALNTLDSLKNGKITLDADSFAQAPDISIDYALMERSKKIAVVACDIGWSDIGSWDAVSELSVPDENGNRTVGETVLYDTNNCYIQSNDRIVSAVGVQDLIIIDTPDALLVVDRSRVQDVKKIVSQLKEKHHDSYKLHKKVDRPWGAYVVLEEGNGFKIKRIEVKPGASLSLQMHHHRSEHWIVVSGIAKVVNGERELLVNTNESTYIPAGHKHRLENPGLLDLVMIEVQSGDYLGEDDIVRFQDNYGRV
ncbi:MAG: mannose-1-phosphate guanylyltransferase/mannose-6-phosphate isomerase [Glaciimonas sp.]|nr:mannose-1-phosphate guanylyltransferase/mannose-6-phosphate isomerase [Glaciimonas sp.]